MLSDLVRNNKKHIDNFTIGKRKAREREEEQPKGGKIEDTKCILLIGK